jgi:hypothetical protein
MKRQQLSLIIDNQMQFEAVEPTDTGFTALSKVSKNFVRRNAAVVTNGNW